MFGQNIQKIHIFDFSVKMYKVLDNICLFANRLKVLSEFSTKIQNIFGQIKIKFQFISNPTFFNYKSKTQTLSAAHSSPDDSTQSSVQTCSALPL